MTDHLKNEARIDLFRQDGTPGGHINIPLDVMEAAARVRAWLRGQPTGTTLHELRLDGGQKAITNTASGPVQFDMSHQPGDGC